MGNADGKHVRVVLARGVVILGTALLSACAGAGERGVLQAPGLVVSNAAEAALGEGSVAHAHSSHCGHYLDGRVWQRLVGHVHGPGCGHAWSDGAWRRR